MPLLLGAIDCLRFPHRPAIDGLHRPGVVGVQLGGEFVLRRADRHWLFEFHPQNPSGRPFDQSAVRLLLRIPWRILGGGGRIETMARQDRRHFDERHSCY